MHNLGTVFGFEVIRTLKKKSFWITAFSFPVIIAVIGMIIFFANQTTRDAAEKAEKQKFSIEVTDDSKLLNPATIQAIGARAITDKSVGKENVRSGKVDAYFYYPKDLTKQSIEVYGKDVGIFENNKYTTVATTLLEQSVGPTIDSAKTAVLKGTVATTATTYKNGTVRDSFKEMIAPGIFLLLFYFLIATFGGQMLTSTTEEKENRVIEMLLTTVRAKTLITGKILAMVVLALIQMLLVVLPAILMYTLFYERLSLPSVDLTNIPLDWARIGVGTALFFLGFMLFTGLLVAIGAAMPTAKEANGFFGVIMILIFAPLYAAPLFVSSPGSPLVQILSFFPFTSPIPLLLRNAVDNLTYPEAAVALVILLISSIAVMALAVRLFRYGALEYASRVRLNTIFGTKKKSARL